MLTLTGTPVNVIVRGDRLWRPAAGFFEFALVGVPLTVGTILIVVLFGSHLLHADRKRPPTDFTATLGRSWITTSSVTRR